MAQFIACGKTANILTCSGAGKTPAPNSQQQKKKERETMTESIRIEKLKSGFYCVWIDGEWVNAALASEPAAKEFAKTWTKSHKQKENGGTKK